MPLRRPRPRWKDNIKMDLKDVRWEDVDWIYLFRAMHKRPTVVNIVLTLRVFIK